MTLEIKKFGEVLASRSAGREAALVSSIEIIQDEIK